MQVIFLNEPFEKLPVTIPEVVLSIGNFDGLHMGHRSLLEQTKSIAKDHGLASAALTFNPHPDEFFSRHPKPEERLFTFDQKIRALEEFELDFLFIQNFHDPFSKMLPETFLQNYLFDHLKVRGVVVGDNFRFGLKREGDSEKLKKFCQLRSLPCETSKPIMHNGEAISSTRIRKTLIHNGHVSEATKLLGRPFLLEGTVGRGDQIGRKIGFPTVNIKHVDQLIPANGVYSGWVWCKARSEASSPSLLSFSNELMLAVFNIGHRPTVHEGGSELHVEAHIINEEIKDNEFYNEKVGAFLCERLRDERKFSNRDELMEAINNDRQKTLDLKARLVF